MDSNGSETKKLGGNYIKGITGRIAVLEHIKSNPDCTASDISAATGLLYETVVKILDRMIVFKEVKATLITLPRPDKRGHVQLRSVNTYVALVQEILGGEELIKQYEAARGKKIERGKVSKVPKPKHYPLPKLKQGVEYYTLAGVQFPYTDAPSQGDES